MQFDIYAVLAVCSFAVQIAAGVAPMLWPDRRWLAGLIFWAACAIAFGSLFFWLYLNLGTVMALFQPNAIMLVGALLLAGGAALEVGRTKLAVSIPEASPPIQVQPLAPPPSFESKADDLVMPRLGTQIAKENFQKALDDMSKIVSRANDMIKKSSTLAGSRPLIQKDTDNGATLVATLQQLSASQKEVYDALMDGSGGQFFANFSPSHKQALQSILPNNSQKIWENYRRELIKFTVAVMLIQDTHRQRLEDGAQFERARANADFAADDFRIATSPLHEWLQSVTRRMDEMSNKI